MSKPRSEVVVTGLGAVTPCGRGTESFWQALLETRDILQELTLFDTSDCLYHQGGEIPPDLYAELERQWQPIPGRAIKLAATALEEALQQAGLSGGDLDSTALISATNFDNADSLEAVFAAAAGLPGSLTPPGSIATSNTILRKTFSLGGPSATMSLSCSSGAAALARAADWITAGRIGRVSIVGYDALSLFAWSGLSALRTMTTDKLRPFDKRRDGTIFSEGAAALVLESSSSAAERGATVLAGLRGWATGNNGTHMTAPAPAGAGTADVLQKTLRKAAITPADIDHYNAHGTGTKLNDSTEAAALHTVLGSIASRIPVTSNKGTVGHLMGAAGAAEAIASILTIRDGLVPPVANLEQQDEDCPLQVVTGKPLSHKVRTVLSNSAGIGGVNAALLLTAPDF